MKVLITGGAGNLGQKLVELLSKAGEGIRVFDLPNVDYSFFDDMEVEIVKGDIRDKDVVREAGEGVDAILHLAALLPPASERDRELTMSINVGGTQNLLEAVGGEKTHFVLCSSVATYGDTTQDDPPIQVSHEQNPLDIYGESKVESEQRVLGSGQPYTILRIASIAIPAILEPPDEWPFMAEQRVEFVNRDDVAYALAACVRTSEAKGKILNIGGGPTWQMLGREYVTSLYEAMTLDPEDAEFSDKPGWFDWYDSSESQTLLDYQNIPFSDFVAQLRQAAKEAFSW